MNADFRQMILELNQKGLRIFPLSKLNAVSIYTADYYENYDYDIVLPNQREKLVKLLGLHNFKQISGRIIRNHSGTVVFEFPKPNFTLGDNPASQAEKLIDACASYIILTPTQALLIYLKRFYSQIQAELKSAGRTPIIDELIDLLYDQPANLEKVREWLGPTNQTDAFVLLKHRFHESQRSGISDRMAHNYSPRISARLAMN